MKASNVDICDCEYSSIDVDTFSTLLLFIDINFVL